MADARLSVTRQSGRGAAHVRAGGGLVVARWMARVRAWLWLAPALTACGGSSPAVHSAQGPAVGAPAAPSFGGEVARVEARGQGVVVALPDVEGWKHDARSERSWVARHAATRSRLIVRRWRHDSARLDDCEREGLALAAHGPALDAADIVERQSRPLAGGDTGQLTIAVRAAPARGREAGAGVEGLALGFGQDGRECLMLAFSTRAAGDGATRVVGERLGVIVETVFARAARVGIADRVAVPRR